MIKSHFIPIAFYAFIFTNVCGNIVIDVRGILMKIIICMGSCCLLRGSYQVTKRLQELVNDYRLCDDDVKLEGDSCFGNCSDDGVSIKINDEVINGVNIENVDNIFKEKVVKMISYNELLMN